MSVGVASTILYKFRSNPQFESLAMPGTSARLFDIKRGIVRAKKLDQGGTPEFDLCVRNAATNEEYINEDMLLPRGTRVVVQRRPASAGTGLLSRIARGEALSSGGSSQFNNKSSNYNNLHKNNNINSSYYTINSKDREEDEEFVEDEMVEGPDTATIQEADETQELEALRAVMEQGATSYRGGTIGSNRTWSVTGAGGGQAMNHQSFHVHKFNSHNRSRPNADPELREQELKQQPKKRATGIPRTFLSFEKDTLDKTNRDTGNNNSGTSNPSNKSSVLDGNASDGGAVGLARLQPNKSAFTELVTHKGGKSSSHPTRSLDYALKVTSMSIPKFLQCGVCKNLVKDAMFIHWDSEGRTACEKCIRDALTGKNNFRCPLTGKEGINPDELYPHPHLRKEADKFLGEVMEKVDIFEKLNNLNDNLNDESSGENKIAVSQIKTCEKNNNSLKQKNDGNNARMNNTLDEDPFGGDVFDVTRDEIETKIDAIEDSQEENPGANKTDIIEKMSDAINREKETKKTSFVESNNNVVENVQLSERKMVNENETKSLSNSLQSPLLLNNVAATNPEHKNQNPMNIQQRPTGTLLHPSGGASLTYLNYQQPGQIQQHQQLNQHVPNHQHLKKLNKGPPAGYIMGPAGGACVLPPSALNPVMNPFSAPPPPFHTLPPPPPPGNPSFPPPPPMPPHLAQLPQPPKGPEPPHKQQLLEQQVIPENQDNASKVDPIDTRNEKTNGNNGINCFPKNSPVRNDKTKESKLQQNSQSSGLGRRGGRGFRGRSNNSSHSDRSSSGRHNSNNIHDLSSKNVRDHSSQNQSQLDSQGNTSGSSSKGRGLSSNENSHVGNEGKRSRSSSKTESDVDNEKHEMRSSKRHKHTREKKEKDTHQPPKRDSRRQEKGSSKSREHRRDRSPHRRSKHSDRDEQRKQRKHGNDRNDHGSPKAEQKKQLHNERDSGSSGRHPVRNESNGRKFRQDPHQRQHDDFMAVPPHRDHQYGGNMKWLGNGGNDGGRWAGGGRRNGRRWENDHGGRGATERERAEFRGRAANYYGGHR